MFSAMLDLKQALGHGQNARLVRARNEDCAYPIMIKNSITNFRAYQFSTGLLKTRNSIEADDSMSEFHKHLALNYKNCYGTPEAVDRYYKTGLLSTDNFKSMGRSHLVKVRDLVKFNASLPDDKNKEYAEMFRLQYFGDNTKDDKHFFDHYTLKQADINTVKIFKRRVWAVELLKPDLPKPRTPVLIYVLNFILYPLKFCPKRRVLQMPEYRCVTYRIGSVVHGFSVEFHIPKKFSF